jgi:hypothetical protein
VSASQEHATAGADERNWCSGHGDLLSVAAVRQPRSFKPADDKDGQAGKCDCPAQRDIRHHAYNDAEEDKGKPDAIPFSSLARETN